MIDAFDHRADLAALDPHEPIVMGILNTTPDSFSDGGSWGTVDRAVTQAERMLTDGARIIDIGGESSRPGADPVTEADELARVLPVIERLAGRCLMSIDTAKPEVAEAALARGASVVNDITASLEHVAGSVGAGWIALHMQGMPRSMQDNPQYDDVVSDISRALADYAARGEAAGVGRMWVDPGIGFGKTTNHNLKLLQSLKNLAIVSPELVIGVSRKRIVGQIHALSDQIPSGETAKVDDRLEGSVLGAVWSWAQGAHIVRVHDVRATALAARLLFRHRT